MRKSTKILLTLSLIAFVLGFTDILWGFGRPVGAICFGLFLISKMLEKEAALYDQEQALRLAEATRASQGVQHAPAKAREVSLTAAIAHR
jgi:hypothetical protein